MLLGGTVPPFVCTWLNPNHTHNSITKDRTEVVIEGTLNYTTGTNEDLAHWQEIEFNCKPGQTSRRPCFISPYHYRIDWLLWFAAFQVNGMTSPFVFNISCSCQDYQHNPWLVHLVGKLLMGDPLVNDLVAYNPFHDKPPKCVCYFIIPFCHSPLLNLGMSEFFIIVTSTHKLVVLKPRKAIGGRGL